MFGCGHTGRIMAEPGVPDELVSWVAQLVATYEIEHLPECWLNHRGLGMELAALRRWQAVAMSDEAGAGDWFAWHDGLGRFRDRLGGVVRRCAGGCVGNAVQFPQGIR